MNEQAPSARQIHRLLPNAHQHDKTTDGVCSNYLVYDLSNRYHDQCLGLRESKVATAPGYTRQALMVEPMWTASSSLINCFVDPEKQAPHSRLSENIVVELGCPLSQPWISLTERLSDSGNGLA